MLFAGEVLEKITAKNHIHRIGNHRPAVRRVLRNYGHIPGGFPQRHGIEIHGKFISRLDVVDELAKPRSHVKHYVADLPTVGNSVSRELSRPHLEISRSRQTGAHESTLSLGS